ncbi:MAG TPA: formylglycine-generating enzyme family protein [Humisphaera sp.]|jgi:formylglycine-generating enzyme required for sulfatase activity|nr:formylglycine-generating enzyme family protein [Humisphaera sp.]
MKLAMLGLIVALLIAPLARADSPTWPLWDGKESRTEYGTRAHLAPTLTLDLGDGIKWEGVLIPAGSFTMGSPAGEAKTPKEAASEAQHKVTITKPFYMGKFEFTQAQYQKVMGANPSIEKGDDIGVHNVAVKDAEELCRKMSRLTGKDVRLPTEAQWEYACRAGTTTPYYNGSTTADLDKIAWFGANSGGKPHPVGQKQPNPWGLYDMLGNIREFTADLYSDDAATGDSDPTGSQSGDPANHTVRGAAYTANAVAAGNMRAGSRRPTESLKSTGFRVIVTLPTR